MIIEGLLLTGIAIAKGAALFDKLSAEKVDHKNATDYFGKLQNALQQEAQKVIRKSSSMINRSKTVSKQIQTATGSKKVSRGKAEQKLVSELKMVSLGAGFAVAGLIYPPFYLVGLACVSDTLVVYSRRAWVAFVKQGKIESDVASFVYFAMAVYSGAYLALILGIWFFRISDLLVLRTENGAKRQLSDLFLRDVRHVWKKVGELDIRIPIEEAKQGDVIRVNAGESVPIDGEVVQGLALVDQQILTGEAQPMDKGIGDEVFAGTLVMSGKLYFKITRTGKDTIASQIATVLTQNNAFKKDLISKTQQMTDQVSGPFLALSAISYPVLGASGALAILYNTPGFRMRFFGPLSMLAYLQSGVERQILIKDGRSLESIHAIDTILFDKTGTLTEGALEVTAIKPVGKYTSLAVLRFAALAETGQTHPIAQAILQAAKHHNIHSAEADDVGLEIGYGIKAIEGKDTILVGSLRFMEMQKITLSQKMEEWHGRTLAQGYSVVFVAIGSCLAGAIRLRAKIRPEVQKVVSDLKARGYKLNLVSGDQEEPTRQLANQLGMDGYFAQVLPQEKAKVVEDFKAKGAKVCFVGDGINDAIALQAAHVSISLCGASTLAMDSAQIILMDNSLEKLNQVFDLGKSFAKDMRNNWLFATIPNMVLVGGTLFFGWSVLASLFLLQIPLPFALYHSIKPALSIDSPKGSSHTHCHTDPTHPKILT